MRKGTTMSAESKMKMRLAHLGKKRPPFSDITRYKMRLHQLGQRHSLQRRIQNSMVQTGEKEFTGFRKPEKKRIRNSTEYKQWRKHVFERDDYTCQSCKKRGGELHADHDLPFALFKDLRFEILNGRTLCAGCHRNTPTCTNLNAIKELYAF